VNRKQFLYSVAGAGLAETLASSGIANGKPKSPKPSLSLNILSASLPPKEAVTSAMGMPPRVLQMSPSDPHLHVAIQNVSTQPIRIWNENNSWGSGNLTLEISAIGRRQLLPPIKVVRNVTVWFSNDFTFTILPPGEMILREITLDVPNNHHGAQAPTRRWPYKGFPLEAINEPNSSGINSFQMRAVFAIEQDGLSIKEEVWTGSVASPEHTYVLNMSDFP
jgi:hypothetical protein